MKASSAPPVCYKCKGPRGPWPKTTLCKPCNRARKALYRANNKDKIKASARLYSLKNRAILAEKDAKYKALNPEYWRQYRRDYYIKNKEKILDQCRAYTAAHQEQYRAYRNSYYEVNKGIIAEKHRKHYQQNKEQAYARVQRRKMRLSQTHGIVTKAEFDLICKNQKYRCAHCQEVCLLHRDHIIPLSKGGCNLAYNIQGLCKSCNSRKNSSMPESYTPSLFDKIA